MFCSGVDKNSERHEEASFDDDDEEEEDSVGDLVDDLIDDGMKLICYVFLGLFSTTLFHNPADRGVCTVFILSAFKLAVVSNV